MIAHQPEGERTNISAFVSAVFSNAWSFVMYGTGAAFLAGWGYITKDVPPNSVIFAIIALGFFAGAFHAWRDERVNLATTKAELNTAKNDLHQAQESKKLRFREEVEHATVTPESSDAVQATFVISVTCLGPPSLIHEWRAECKTPDGRMLAVEPSLVHINDSLAAKDVFRRDNRLISDPIIPTAQNQRHRLIFSIPTDFNQPRPVNWMFVYKDSNGDEHRFSYKLA